MGEHPDVHVYGYVSEVAALMQACDCIITKPGGITLSEALACRLPIFLYRPVPGQELNNALYLQKKGVAMVAEDPGTLTGQIEALLSDEERQAAVAREIENLAGRRPRRRS